MPRSSDLSSLFGKPQPGIGQNVRVVAGQILTFSQADGSNTIDVMGGTLTNVPMAISGAEVDYVAGDPVFLTVIGNTYFLLCKVATVGSSQFASTATSSIGYYGSTSGFAIAGSLGTVVTTTFKVPVWSDRMTFFSAMEVAVYNHTTDTDIYGQIVTNGNPSGAITGFSPNGHTVKYDKFQSGVQTVTPGSTITVSGQMYAGGGLPANGAMYAQVSGTVLFTKQ